jgi:hypothetical protein
MGGCLVHTEMQWSPPDDPPRPRAMGPSWTNLAPVTALTIVTDWVTLHLTEWPSVNQGTLEDGWYVDEIHFFIIFLSHRLTTAVTYVGIMHMHLPT